MPISGGSYTLPTNAFAQPVANTQVPAASAAETLSDIELAIDSLVDGSGLADGAIGNAEFRDSAALSVVGRSANSTGDVADITGTDGQVLRVSGTTLGFGTVAAAGLASDSVTTAKIADNNVTIAKLEQGAARSVILRAANSTGNYAASAPAAGSFNLLMESNNVLGWSKLIYQNIDSSAFANESTARGLTDTTYIMNSLGVYRAIGSGTGFVANDYGGGTTTTLTIATDVYALIIRGRGGGGGGGSATAYAAGGGGGQGGGNDWFIYNVTPGTVMDIVIPAAASAGAAGGTAYVKFPLAISGGLDELELQFGGGQPGGNASGATPGQGGLSGNAATNTPDQGGTAEFPTGWTFSQQNIPGVHGQHGHYDVGGYGGATGDNGAGGDGADVGGSADAGLPGYIQIIQIKLGDRA